MELKIKLIIIAMIILIMTVPLANSYANQNYKEKNVVEPVKKPKKVKKVKRIEKPVFAPGTFKSFMDGAMITDTSSAAYKQICKMKPDENGVYSEGKYKAIAMAKFYGEIGDKFRITLSSGTVFYGVMTDTKQPGHVNSRYEDKVNGSIIEFIVDTNLLLGDVLLTGSLDCIYPGKIIKIEKENIK